MVDFPNKAIYLYSNGVDFRKGIKSLTNLVSTSFKETELKDSLYIFFSKDRKGVKILEVENGNAWLYQNKLNDSKFVFPLCDKTAKIDVTQLKLILKSVEYISRTKI